MWLFFWVIFLPTYLDGLFYSSPNSANFSCSRLLNKTWGIFFGKRLSVFALSTMRYSFRWENLSHIFDIRKSSIFADFNRNSNKFSGTTTYCKSIISVQIILRTRDFPLWNSLLKNICIFVINWFRITADPSSEHLIRYFIFISSSDILIQGTSVLVTPDWLCPIASVMGASFVFIFVLTRGSINSPICHTARNKCVRPTIS